MTDNHEETASNHEKFMEHYKSTVDTREQMEDNFYEFRDYRLRAENVFYVQ